MHPTKTISASYGSSTVAKALAILNRLAMEGGPMSAADLARALRMNGSSIYRLLATLVHHNYLTQDQGTARYFLGHQILALGSTLLNSLDIRRIARPSMVELMKKTGEAIHLMMLEGMEGVYIERVESPHAIQMISTVGRREFLHASSIGKAILAHQSDERIDEIITVAGLPRFTGNTITDSAHLKQHLKDIKARGYAIDDMEAEDGVRCIGTAIYNHMGCIKYGVSIAGPAYRLSIEKLLSFTDILLSAARHISELLGYMPLIKETVNLHKDHL